MKHRAFLSCIALLGLLPALSAQSRKVLLAEGDAVPGLGDLVRSTELEINDQRAWMAHVFTRQPPGVDEALFQGGPVLVREGMRLENPQGATLTRLDSTDINDRGDIAFVGGVRLDGLAQVHDAVFWNTKFLAKRGDSFDPGSPLVPAGTTFDSIDLVRLNDRGTLLVAARMKTIVSPQLRSAVIKYQLDGLGNVTSTALVAFRNQSLPALPGALFIGVSRAEASLALNDHGDMVYLAETSLGRAVLLNTNVPLAREGSASPVGRNWSFLASSQVALNDVGGYVLTGYLEGTTERYLIEKSGQKFAQEGDVLPAFSPLPLARGATAPVPVPIHLANNGDVFWHARVEGGPDEAFMRNYEPIVRPGTLVEGRKVAKLDSSGTAFTISPDGRFFLCNVELADGVPATLLLDFGLALELPGCAGNPGTLRLSAGQVRIGQGIELAMDSGHVAGALARIDLAKGPRLAGSSCGVLTPAGEVLISARRLGSLSLPPWDGVNPTSVAVQIPNDPALLNATIFAQGTFRTPGSAERSLTNALRIEIGAP